MLIGKKAPDFKAKMVKNKEILDISLSDYNEKYIVLFFYPADFTFVCPTELHAFQEKLNEFETRNVELLGCSVDSVFSHLAWLNIEKKEAGIKGIEYGLISDLGAEIAKTYKVLNNENIAYRATFIIDQKQIIRSLLINDMPIGRNIEEIIRIIDAIKFHEKNGQVCPANWKLNEKAIDTNLNSVKDYLNS